jgi:hypothetical protein
MDPAAAPIFRSGDHVLPLSGDEVKNSWPGCTLKVTGLRWCPQISASTAPSGCTTMDAS